MTICLSRCYRVHLFCFRFLIYIILEVILGELKHSHEPVLSIYLYTDCHCTWLNVTWSWVASYKYTFKFSVSVFRGNQVTSWLKNESLPVNGADLTLTQNSSIWTYGVTTMYSKPQFSVAVCNRVAWLHLSLWVPLRSKQFAHLSRHIISSIYSWHLLSLLLFVCLLVCLALQFFMYLGKKQFSEQW